MEAALSRKNSSVNFNLRVINGIINRVMGFFAGKKKIMACSNNPSYADFRWIVNSGSRLSSSAIYLHIILAKKEFH